MERNLHPRLPPFERAGGAMPRSPASLIVQFLFGPRGFLYQAFLI